MGSALDLGALVREHRRRRAWSQETLAERAGISVRGLRDIERGRVSAPRPDTLRLLAEALDLDETARERLVAGGEPPGPVIAQLPAAVADFTGRGDIVARLERLLAQRPPEPSAQVVVVGGQAGVGKTALAVQVAHLVRSAFADGQLFAELHGAHAHPASPSDVLGAFLRSLGVEGAALPDDLGERAALLRSLLDGRRMLLLLDDARDAAQVRPLLPGTGDCAVLVTARARLADLEGAQFINLGLLDEVEASDLLSRVAGRDRVVGDPVAARRVVTACGGLPLAVRIAGARVAAWPERSLHDLAELLADEHGRLDHLAVGDLEIRSSIGLSYRALPEESRRAFRLLGLLAVTEVPGWAAPALLDRPAGEATSLLDHLVDVHLVDMLARPGDVARYRLHDLVRLYAQECARSDGHGESGTAAVARAGGAWLALAEQAEPRLPGGFVRTATGPSLRWLVPAPVVERIVEHPDAWFAGERSSVLGLLRQAVELGLDELAWDLAGVVTRFLRLRGHYDDLVRISQLGLVAARRLSDPRAEGLLLRIQGEIHAELDRYAEAADCLQRARALSRDAGDERNEAWSMQSLSCVVRVQAQWQEARSLADAALVAFRRLGDATGVAQCRYGLGTIAREQAHVEEAAAHYEAALDGFRQQGDRHNEGLVLLSLARLHQARGRTHEEAVCLAQALDIGRAINHLSGVAWSLAYLGDHHVDRGDRDAAEPFLVEALALGRRTGDRYCQAVILYSLGRLRLAGDAPAAAEAFLRRSIEIAEDVDLPLQKGRGLVLLGDAQLLRGVRNQAARSWQNARDLLGYHGFPEAREAEERLRRMG